MQLSEIKTRVRDHTGLQSTGQLSEADLLTQINKFYRDVLPLELIDSVFLEGYWTATAVVGDDSYDVSDDYLSLGSVIYVAGDPIILERDVDGFYAVWPESTVYSNGEVSAALFYGRSILLRPPPDDTYALKIPAKVKPAAFVNATDIPLDPVWGELIAYGTAILILKSKGDTGAATELAGDYQYWLGLATVSKVMELSQQRSIPRF